MQYFPDTTTLKYYLTTVVDSNPKRGVPTRNTLIHRFPKCAPPRPFLRGSVNTFL